ncbi:MmpL domain-containing protein [Candidatus Protofrankia californiensis]|uniref:MmpL domain-containing protein n=1 Tax=Candidatus Protofrankia californiensis TaxID=1839754 RepID=A0A1C3NVS9_9ACTN|nr:MmpL domain-containing protein [Candidatus Protofrankia californiensis]
MSALARWCLRHRRLVISFWIVAFLAGGATAGTTAGRLTFDFSLPGQPGYETAKKVLETYHTESQGAPIILVLSTKPGEKVTDQQATDSFAAVERDVHGVRVVGRAETGDDIFVTGDGRAQFAYAFYPPQTSFTSETIDDLKKSLAQHTPTGLTGSVTGLDELATNGANDSGPGVLLETLLAGLGALAILAFVFASLLALLPLLVAAVAILSTFLVLLGLTVFADVSFLVQFLVSLIGLGVAIDYSLLIVTRWREERAHGRDNHDAVVASMESAGHAVLFSGLTVAIGLVALVVIPVPFLRSVGYGGMLIPLISVAVTTTLLPALLGGIGPRVDWPRIRHENTASRFWTRWASLLVRHRWIGAGVGIAILTALIIPFFGVQIGTAQSGSLAKTGPAYEALKVLEDGGAPKGILTPAEILVQSPVAGDVVRRARAVDGVVTATAPTGPESNQAGTSLIIAVPDKETAGGSSTDPIRRMRSALHDVPGVIGLTGIGALQLDYLHGVYGVFPWALALIVIVTYVLLVRAFRSLLLPLKAVLLNLVSLGATFGATVLFWQHGYGSEQIYGIEATGAITFWLPLMVFAFLFGLSMDYEVFILARIREEYDTRGDTNAAVIEGVGRTGRLVTSAALILFLSFLSLSTGPQTDIKLFATALGFGILLDATVVRMLLVPALVSLFGSWNWYLPDWVAKLLRIEKSHPQPAVPEPRSRPEPSIQVPTSSR